MAIARFPTPNIFIYNVKLNNEEIFGLLKKLHIEKYYTTKVMYLSSGVKKKLELLRLIVEQKKLWVMDEPFNHLDNLSIEILTQTFLDHVNNNGMILFTSHLNPIISNLKTLELN